jgi:hypothetical protein
MAEVDTQWHYRGLQVVRLQNEQVCLDVLPEVGAKIYNFVHRPSGRNLLWHNPGIQPAKQEFGSVFDDNWSGGWDELIPNDLPCTEPEGDMLPDHGEVWSQGAEWEVLQSGGDCAQVRFNTRTRVVPALFEKTLTVRKGESFCRVRYRVTNLSPAPYAFLWNIHPAMVISPDTWLDVPAKEGFTDPWRETRFPGHGQVQWPIVKDRHGDPCDLRQVEPASSALADHHYLTNITEGWYAVTDRRHQVGFGLVFPVKVFPNVWLFRTFGGWRGLYTLILEASTGRSRSLVEAREKNECAHLQSGTALDVEVLAVAYGGVTGVARIEPDGRVIAAPATQR